MAGPALQYSQNQSLDLRQKLAPQMQQSLAILQATALELGQMVGQELVENPVLEEESTDISLEEEKLDRDAEDIDEEFDEMSKLDDEWREYLQQSKSSAPRRDDDAERRQHMMDSLVEAETLPEHLLEQLGTSDAEGEVRALAEMLIGNIDEDGLLPVDIEDMALENALPFQKLKQALEIVQSFYPAGVGAQNLRECLLIQLERDGRGHSLEFRIIDKHLDDLARKRFPQIARKLGVTPEQITAAAEAISHLEPKPGRAFTPSTNQYITPDVTVTRDAGDYVVVINNEHVPHLRISNTYKDIMSSGGAAAQEAKEYIREKIRAGKFLIKSIHQRQDTIRRIAEQIVERQRDFLDAGVSHLKPMNMAQIAKVVGVHETTVSRAIAGKYISTPRGVYEMRYFFKPGYETESGETMSNTSVKQAVAEIVKEEDTRKPLSDDKIVNGLAEKGIKIARRTVAKYRDELGILPSHLRRSY